MNAYEILGIAEALCLDENQLSGLFLQRAKCMHPDVGGNATDFAALERAYQCLREPSTRLREWLRLKGREFDARGEIDGKMVDFFGQLSCFFCDLDGFLQKRERVSSALARAMMESEAQQWRQRIEDWQANLQDAWKSKIQQFPEFESGAQEFAVVESVARDLIFIEKWQAQLRDRYARLWS